jgi:hypothetical protein
VRPVVPRSRSHSAALTANQAGAPSRRASAFDRLVLKRGRRISGWRSGDADQKYQAPAIASTARASRGLRRTRGSALISACCPREGAGVEDERLGSRRDAPRAWIAGLVDRDGVQHGIELPITAGVESMPCPLATRCSERSGAGVTGEMVGRRKPGDVPDVAKQLRSQNRTDAVNFGQSRCDRGDRVTHLSFVGFDSRIETS